MPRTMLSKVRAATRCAPTHELPAHSEVVLEMLSLLPLLFRPPSSARRAAVSAAAPPSLRLLLRGTHRQPNTNLGPNRQPTNHARGHVPYKSVPWVKESSDVRVFSFPSMRQARASVLSQDRRGRARKLPTRQDCEERRPGLQIWPLLFQGREGGQGSHDWNVALTKNDDDRYINRAQSFNRWVTGVDSLNTSRPITPRRTNNQTHNHQRRENKRGRCTRARSVNTFWLNTLTRVDMQLVAWDGAISGLVQPRASPVLFCSSRTSTWCLCALASVTFLSGFR